jgi:hypothetical protein
MKEAERRWKAVSNYHGFPSHKNGDVRYCIHCGKPLPKSVLKPDYTVSLFETHVECKNDNKSHEAWLWAEIGEDGERSLQRKFFQENGGWLFIELGQGRAPDGKRAWLVPWFIWVRDIEPKLLETGQKSIRFETIYNKDNSPRRGYFGGDILFHGYEMEWKPGEGWIIPVGHLWWKAYHAKLVDELERVENFV